MKLFFPGPIQVGRVVKADLRRVVRNADGSCTGRYRLEPLDMNEFGMRVGGLKGLLGRRYEPVPGVWASYVESPDSAEVELWVGLDARFGYAMRRAAMSLKLDPPAIVSEGMIRALGLGYLERSGV